LRELLRDVARTAFVLEVDPASPSLAGVLASYVTAFEPVRVGASAADPAR
jgi:hypothetical protein